MTREHSRRFNLRVQSSAGRTYREVAQNIENENRTIPFRLVFLLHFSIRKARGDHGVNHDIQDLIETSRNIVLIFVT